MISRTAQYALVVISHLVGKNDERTTGETIAQHTGIPANYLSKVLGQLRKQGFLDAEKGWGGGFRVRKDALNRPIREILMAIDGPERTDPEECIFGLPRCDSTHPCPLHSYWERIRETRTEMLSMITVADLKN